MMYLGYDFSAPIPNKKKLPRDVQSSVSVESMKIAEEFILAVKDFIGKKLELFKEPTSLKPESVAVSIMENFVILSRYHFLPALSWAPNNVNCWDRIPVSYDRYPKTYGHINFAALEGPNKKTFFSSSPLGSDNDGYRYILWICHLTTCWKPIKEWTLFDTHTERFNVVKGI